MNEIFSLLMVWLVCVQIWDMTQVVGSSVAAGFSPRWLVVSEGTAHTPPTEIMETLTYLSNSPVLQLWSLRKTDTSTWFMWIYVSFGMLLDFMNQTDVHVSYEVWWPGFEQTWTQGTSKSTIFALFLCVYMTLCHRLKVSEILYSLYPEVPLKQRKYPFITSCFFFSHLSCLSILPFLNLNAIIVTSIHVTMEISVP